MFVRVLVGLAGGLFLLSALGGIAAGMLNQPKPAWFFVMFEVVGLPAGVFAVLFAAGRVRGSPAMTLACIAGTILVVAVLGGLAIQWKVAGIPLLVPEIARGGIVVIFGFCSLYVALGSDSAVRRVFIYGVALAVAFAVLSAGGWWGLRPGGPVHALPGFLVTLVATALYLVLTAALAASVHLIVRAFTMARRR